MSQNHAHSVRTKLLNRARNEGEDFQRLLVRYAIERLLYRLSLSHYADDFVLKGATLFAIWLGKPHRATKDLDLLGRGSPSVERLTTIFVDIAGVSFPEDGVLFETDQITGAAIRKEALYLGVRHDG